MRTLLFSLLLLLSLCRFSYVYAQEGESNIYKLQLDDVRYEEPTPIPHVDASDTVLYGSDKDEFENHGYVIHHSLPYQTEPSSLSINLSQTRVGYDTESIDTAVEKVITGAVSSDNTYSYQLLTVQQKPLSSQGGTVIENTSCNVALLPCTTTLARHWDASGAYGFGYRIEGDDTPEDFRDKKNYRPFPVNSLREEPVTLLENQNTSGTKQFSLFLKVIFPPSFQEGTYTGDISIIALPKL